MAQVNVSPQDLRKLAGISKEDAIETLTMLGFPTEEMDDGNLDVEVTPNRPDALCAEGLARAIAAYKTGTPMKIRVGAPRIEVAVDKSVADVRPVFCGAVVRGLDMDEALLRSLMQLQEKLHETLGRKRRKVAIGIHDLDAVSPPFRYFACGRSGVSFVPLERNEKMTPGEILKKHEKGVSYAHLVGEKCPMIADSQGEVLSFPPIINGERTKLALKTKNIFIDATGTSGDAVRQAVGIIAAALAFRGGNVEMISINGKPCRILEETRRAMPLKAAERLLGVKLGKAACAKLLLRMGHAVSGNSVCVQGYRTDVMSDADLIEDIAIAYGYNNFEPTLPSFPSIGKASPEPPYHEILVGLGFDEAMTWTLSNERACANALLPASGAIGIENPLTEDFAIFRKAILPSLLSVLFESRNEKLPIKLYEIGPVGTPALEKRLAAVSMHPKASFSEIKGIALALSDAAGMKIEVRAEDFGPFVPGRCAAIYLDGKRAGFFGEIAPQALFNFSLEQPVCALEMKI